MKKIFTVFSVLMLGACLGGYSPQSKFYDLHSIKQHTEVVSEKKISVGVNAVELPAYLDKPQIVSFDLKNNQMKIDEFNRWGEPLASMIQRTIAADMSEYLPNSVVKIRSSLAERFDLLVDIQIVKFDRFAGDKAVLEAWWYISSVDGKILHRHKLLLEQKINSTYDGYVEAMSDLLAKMSKDMAFAIVQY